MHELTGHKQASFVTLTYDPEHLPTNDGIWPSLQPYDVALFLKRLRKNLGPNWGPIKVIYTGEYGERRARPHYHLIIFGVDFRDAHVFRTKHEVPSKRNKFKLVTKTRKNLNTIGASLSPNPNHYTSTFLSFLWTYGHHDIGPVTPESIAYCCSYTLEKQKNKQHLSPTQYPEFVRYSNRGGGIGKSFIANPLNLKTLVDQDTFVLHNQSYHPPRYYSDYLKKKSPEKHEQLVAERLKKMKTQQLSNLTTIKQLNQFKRDKKFSSRVL